MVNLISLLNQFNVVNENSVHLSTNLVFESAKQLMKKLFDLLCMKMNIYIKYNNSEKHISQ